MRYEVEDFNDATDYFLDEGRDRWSELEDVLARLRPQLQASDQAGRVGRPIFDPKGTNAALTRLAGAHRWHSVPVPLALRPFGTDWDAGKGAVLAEWQFSNYPFLWNNIIRTEAIFQSKAVLPGLARIMAMIIVTKSGGFPASNSTLYFEQARAQIQTVTSLRVFRIPIRLIGLAVGPDSTVLEAQWNTYLNRYGREVAESDARQFRIDWAKKVSKYGHRTAVLTPLPSQTR